jgi:hypothetical protein
MAASSKVTRPAHTWQRTSSAVSGVSFTSVGVGTKQALHEFVRLSTRIFKVLLTSSRCQVVSVPITPPSSPSSKTQTKQLPGWKDLFQKQMFMERFCLTYRLLGEIVESGLAPASTDVRP